MQSSQTPAFAEHADHAHNHGSGVSVDRLPVTVTFRCLLLLPFVLCLFVTALILNKVVV